MSARSASGGSNARLVVTLATHVLFFATGWFSARSTSSTTTTLAQPTAAQCAHFTNAALRSQVCKPCPACPAASSLTLPSQRQEKCPPQRACPECEPCPMPSSSSSSSSWFGGSGAGDCDCSASKQTAAISGGAVDVGGDEVSTALLEGIYRDSLAESKRAFTANGGVKDKVQISAGQGPKLRIWDYYGPFYNCASRERVGRIGDGGKWLCGVRTFLAKRKSRPCVVYSIGSKGEVSFEHGVVQKLKHCELHIFDPTLTPEQKEAVRAVRGAHFHDVGLGAKDGELKIEEGRRHLQSSLLWTQKTKKSYPVKTLTTIMAELGHEWVDVLKVDIEGGEWGVFGGLQKSMRSLPATQVQIELHFLDSIEDVRSFFAGMAAWSFRVFNVEPNYYGRTAENARRMVEYSFVQVDDNTGAITDGL